MYLSEYLSVFDKNQLILEIALPKQQQMAAMAQPPSTTTSSDDALIEFEPIKKYILYNKLKEIKNKLYKTKLNRTNANVQSVFDFINLTLNFFNTFTYSDCKKLIDRIADMIVIANNLQLSSQRLQLEPELDKVKVQQKQAQDQQAQQQQQELEKQKQQIEKQQANQDHMANLQKRSAELDLLNKRIDLGMKMHHLSKGIQSEDEEEDNI